MNDPPTFHLEIRISRRPIVASISTTVPTYSTYTTVDSGFAVYFCRAVFDICVSKTYVLT